MEERTAEEHLRRGEVGRVLGTRKTESERTRKKRRGYQRWGGRQRRERPVVLLSLAAFGLWRGGGAFR